MGLTLGIDPGYGRMGYACVEREDAMYRLRGEGLIETPSSMPFHERLILLHTAVRDIVKAYRPADAAVEDLFFAKNVKTAIDVAQARGVIVHAIADSGVPIYEYTPIQVKSAVTGNGRANKDAVITMIALIARTDRKIVQDDTADAVAVAICHLQRHIDFARIKGKER